MYEMEFDRLVIEGVPLINSTNRLRNKESP